MAFLKHREHTHKTHSHTNTHTKTHTHTLGDTSVSDLIPINQTFYFLNEENDGDRAYNAYLYTCLPVHLFVNSYITHFFVVVAFFLYMLRNTT